MSKKTSILHKIFLFINGIFALLLLVAFLGALINPKHLKFISLISLTTPFLLIINILFILFWVVKAKKYFLISVITIAIGYSSLGRFYQFSGVEIMKSLDTKLMSFNVRLFNHQQWIKDADIPSQMRTFFKNTNPDILCLQEYYPLKKAVPSYPYKYVKFHPKGQTGLAIFSKYKIVSSGKLTFPKSSNSAIFADIIKEKDTVRIYNIHLQSLKINPQQELNTERTKNLLRRMEIGFKKQVMQVEILQKHQKESPYKTIICGDFNNTAFSWVYNQLKKDKNDAFTVAGKGFGKTYDYTFPFRIDFILPNKEFKINNFTTYYKKYSDHYPIMARIEI